MNKMVEISKIIDQNPWWKGKEFQFWKYDEHLAKYEIAKFKIYRKFISPQSNNVYSISGPRQAGKTTWIKLMIRDLLDKKEIDASSVCYFSCDTLLSRSRKELRKVLDYFLERLAKFDKGFIFLDEVSYVKDWAFEIKNLADSGKLSKISLFLSGSPLGIKEVEFLPGRHVEGNRYFLKPLSFREFVLNILNLDVYWLRYLSSDVKLIEGLTLLKEKLEKNWLTLDEEFEVIKEKIESLLPFKDALDFLLNFYLRTGGFPSPVESYLINKKIERKIYETIVNVILSDISKRGKSEDIAKQVLYALIKRIGSAYDFRALTKDLEEGVSVNTIIDYLKVFEDSFLIKTLYSYDFEKKQKRQKGNKKVYFTDPFLFYSILSWLEGKDGFEATEDILTSEEKISQVLEMITFSSLQRTKEIPLIRDSSTFLWFYYDKKGEIDFILKQESNEYLGVEVKYQPEVPKKIREIPMVKNYIILSKDTFEASERVLIVPISLFLALIKSSDYHL
jgi:predicted AAA+ superfamily ATPase